MPTILRTLASVISGTALTLAGVGTPLHITQQIATTIQTLNQLLTTTTQPAKPVTITTVLKPTTSKTTTTKTITSTLDSQTLIDLNKRISNLSDTLNNRINSISMVNQQALAPVYQMVSLSNKIDQLTGTTISGATITSPTISGGTITDSSFSGSTLTLTGGLSGVGATFTGNVGIGTTSPQSSLDVLNTSASSLQDGLVAWWPLNEGSGTVAYDVVAGRNGTFSGSPIPTWVSDSGGNALKLDGTFGTKVIPDANGAGPLFAFTGDFSASIWVNVLATDAKDGSYPFFMGNEVLGIWNGWRLHLQPTGTVTFGVDHTGSCCIEADGTTNIAGDGHWHLITGVRTGDNLNLYVDGVLEATGTGAASALSPSGNFTIGADPNNYYDSHHSVGDARIWSRAITSTEAATLYSQGRIGQNPTAKQNVILNHINGDTNSLSGVGNSSGQGDLLSQHFLDIVTVSQMLPLLD